MKDRWFIILSARNAAPAATRGQQQMTGAVRQAGGKPSTQLAKNQNATDANSAAGDTGRIDELTMQVTT